MSFIKSASYTVLPPLDFISGYGPVHRKSFLLPSSKVSSSMLHGMLSIGESSYLIDGNLLKVLLWNWTFRLQSYCHAAQSQIFMEIKLFK